MRLTPLFFLFLIVSCKVSHSESAVKSEDCTPSKITYFENMIKLKEKRIPEIEDSLRKNRDLQRKIAEDINDTESKALAVDGQSDKEKHKAGMLKIANRSRQTLAESKRSAEKLRTQLAEAKSELAQFQRDLARCRGTAKAGVDVNVEVPVEQPPVESNEESKVVVHQETFEEEKAEPKGCSNPERRINQTTNLRSASNNMGRSS